MKTPFWCDRQSSTLASLISRHSVLCKETTTRARMSTASFNIWVTLVLFSFCLHNVVSEELQFLAIPKRRPKILSIGSSLTINCTTNNQTAHTALYYRPRSRTRLFAWKKVETIPGKLVEKDHIYTLVNVTRINKGQYQCRAWTTLNSTMISWPNNVGILLIPREGSKRGPKKPGEKMARQKKRGQKKRGQKKRGPKKQGPKKLGPKTPEPKTTEPKTPEPKTPEPKTPTRIKPIPKKRGPKKRRPKKRRPKKQGQIRPGQKRTKQKRPNQKRTNRKKPNRKRPGQRRPKGKKPGQKRPGSKSPGSKRPGSKRQERKRPGSKKHTKQGPKVKVVRNAVSVNEGSIAVLKCSGKVLGGGQQPTISWYRSNKLIGCSNKKDSKCASSQPYRVTYMVNVGKGRKVRVASHLKIVKTKRVRDQDSYVCIASNKHGSARQTIRLIIK